MYAVLPDSTPVSEARVDAWSSFAIVEIDDTDYILFSDGTMQESRGIWSLLHFLVLPGSHIFPGDGENLTLGVVFEKLETQALL